MSGKHGNHPPPPARSVSDDPKLTLEDKFAGTDSATFDSGYQSCTNSQLQSSSSEVIEDHHPDNLLSSDNSHHLPESGDKMKIEIDQQLDSGVDNDSEIVDSFSSLCLKNPQINDLSSSTKSIKSSPQEPPVAGDDADSRARLDAPEEPWKRIFQQNEDGNTLLHVAIDQGYVKHALWMIKAAPHPHLLDTPNDNALAPIHLATLLGQRAIVRWLIVAGAKPNPRNMSGDSPLHIAARAGDVECCKAISSPVQEIERIELGLSHNLHMNYQLDFNQWNYEGQTCVHVAAREGQIEVLRHLVWNGADINAREGLGGYTALHYAVETGNESLATFLLQECSKLQASVLSYGGRSALQIGCTLSPNVADFLKTNGVPGSPFSSDEEYTSESDFEDDVELYENQAMYGASLVNANA